MKRHFQTTVPISLRLILLGGLLAGLLALGNTTVTYAINPQAAPSVTTIPATQVTSAAATLNGFVNPNGSATTAWFRYSTSNPGTCNDSFGTRVPASGGTSLGAGGSDVGYSYPISGLTPQEVYYFCVIANNGGGKAFGSVLQRSDAQQLCQPEWPGGDGLVPLQHDRSHHLLRRLWHPGSRQRRYVAGFGQLECKLFVPDLWANARRSLLFLCHRGEWPGKGIRIGPGLHHGFAAPG